MASQATNFKTYHGRINAETTNRLGHEVDEDEAKEYHRRGLPVWRAVVEHVQRSANLAHPATRVPQEDEEEE
jgi:hypothetical protein